MENLVAYAVMNYIRWQVLKYQHYYTHNNFYLHRLTYSSINIHMKINIPLCVFVSSKISKSIFNPYKIVLLQLSISILKYITPEETRMTESEYFKLQRN